MLNTAFNTLPVYSKQLVPAHTCVYMCVRACVGGWVHACVYACAGACMYVCAGACMYVCAYGRGCTHRRSQEKCGTIYTTKGINQKSVHKEFSSCHSFCLVINNAWQV